MIADAASRLLSKGLLAPGDSLSQRLPERNILLQIVVGPAGDLPPPEEVSLDAGHGWIYRQRPDVGAVLLSRQNWAAALAEFAAPMPGIFDEQIRHLGRSVRRIGEGEPLAGGANAFLVEGRVLCLGMTLPRLIFNAELLEKCAKAFILATGTGGKVHRIPWLVRHIANRRLLRDEKYAAQCHLNGQSPQLSSAY